MDATLLTPRSIFVERVTRVFSGGYFRPKNITSSSLANTMEKPPARSSDHLITDLVMQIDPLASANGTLVSAVWENSTTEL